MGTTNWGGVFRIKVDCELQSLFSSKICEQNGKQVRYVSMQVVKREGLQWTVKETLRSISGIK